MTRGSRKAGKKRRLRLRDVAAKKRRKERGTRPKEERRDREAPGTRAASRSPARKPRSAGRRPPGGPAARPPDAASRRPPDAASRRPPHAASRRPPSAAAARLPGEASRRPPGQPAVPHAAPGPAAPSSPRGLDLHAFFQVMGRRWAIATATGVVLFTTSVVLGTLRPDLYLASTRILKKSADRELRLRGVPGVLDDYTLLETASRVVLSRPVMEGALGRLRERMQRLRGLTILREDAPAIAAWTPAQWKAIREAAAAAPAAEDPADALDPSAARWLASLDQARRSEIGRIEEEDLPWVRLLASLPDAEVRRLEGLTAGDVLERVTARVEENGDVLAIAVEDGSPRVAAALANAVAESFLDLNLEMLHADAEDALRSGEDLLTARQREIDRLDQDLERLWLERAEALHEAGLPGEGAAGDVLAALRAKQGEIDDARFELRRTEERIRGLRGELEKVSDASLEGILEGLKVKLADYRARYTAENPLVQRLEGNVTYVEGLLEDRRAEVIRGERLPDSGIGASLLHSLVLAESDRNALVERLDELRSQGKAIAGADEAARRVDAEIAKLDQQRDGIRSIVKMIEMRRHEAMLAAGAQAAPFFLLERAEPATQPFSPQRERIAIVGFLLALLAAVGAAFVVEHMDASVRTFADVERSLGLPVLGVVPRWRRREGAVARGAELSVVNLEVFGLVRNHIHLAPRPDAASCLLITSPLPGEGKTATCANLALSYAVEGVRVAVVDLDLRRGRDHPLLHALAFHRGPDRGGLADLLQGRGDLDGKLARAETAPAVMLPAGAPLPHPAKLFATEAFAGILERLRRRYDVVLLDGPPVLPFTDVTILASLVRGVLLVVEWGRTPLASARRTWSRLEAARAPLLGVVLNKARALAREDLTYAYHPPATKLPPMDVLSGTRAMRAGLITQGQLLEALREQDEARERGAEAPPLGEILVEKGWVLPGELEGILHGPRGEDAEGGEGSAAASGGSVGALEATEPIPGAGGEGEEA